jgi:hypothetical protein
LFSGAPWAFRGTHRATVRLQAEPYFQNSGAAFNVPGERVAWDRLGDKAPNFRCNPYAGFATKFETVMLS